MERTERGVTGGLKKPHPVDDAAETGRFVPSGAPIGCGFFEEVHPGRVLPGPVLPGAVPGSPFLLRGRHSELICRGVGLIAVVWVSSSSPRCSARWPEGKGGFPQGRPATRGTGGETSSTSRGPPAGAGGELGSREGEVGGGLRTASSVATVAVFDSKTPGSVPAQDRGRRNVLAYVEARVESRPMPIVTRDARCCRERGLAVAGVASLSSVGSDGNPSGIPSVERPVAGLHVRGGFATAETCPGAVPSAVWGQEARKGQQMSRGAPCEGEARVERDSEGLRGARPGRFPPFVRVRHPRRVPRRDSLHGL